MTKRLTEDQLKSKMRFHEKKVTYYKDKIGVIDKDKKRIGFRRYD